MGFTDRNRFMFGEMKDFSGTGKYSTASFMSIFVKVFDPIFRYFDTNVANRFDLRDTF